MNKSKQVISRALQGEFYSVKYERSGIPNTVRLYFEEKICRVMLKEKSSGHLFAGKDFC